MNARMKIEWSLKQILNQNGKRWIKWWKIGPMENHFKCLSLNIFFLIAKSLWVSVLSLPWEPTTHLFWHSTNKNRLNMLHLHWTTTSTTSNVYNMKISWRFFLRHACAYYVQFWIFNHLPNSDIKTFLLGDSEKLWVTETCALLNRRKYNIVLKLNIVQK